MVLRMLPKQGLMVRNFCTEPEGTMRFVAKVANNTLGSFKMTDSRGSTITTEGHDSMSNVQTAQRDSPLKGTDETLVLDNVFRGAEVSVVKFRVVIFGQGCANLLWRTKAVEQLLVRLLKTFDVGLATET